MPIYGAPSYALGAAAAALTAPVTKATAAQAKRELQRMKRSLTRWLRYRAINDQVANGAAGAVRSPVLKYPGAQPPPAAVAKMRLPQIRQGEAALAMHLHQLLSEVFDAAALPSPDVTQDPDAAAKLASIAIAGKVPGEGPTPTPVGAIPWVWPAVIVVGGIVLVLTTLIRSNADEAMEREHLECVKSGKCTDTGFWLKAGAVGLIGWLAWDKAGLGHRLTGILKGGRRR